MLHSDSRMIFLKKVMLFQESRVNQGAPVCCQLFSLTTQLNTNNAFSNKSKYITFLVCMLLILEPEKAGFSRHSCVLLPCL